ncbi:MAG: MFS transporter, partial [Acidobacteriaceae bacterium]|nr:MFS transporter [Acidobacteriaceae bacterium]
GACTSSIGTWMQMLAQSWLVYEISHSAVYLGLDTFFGQIPIFLFSLFGGVFADRKNRRTLLLMSQWIQLTCAFLLAILVAKNVVRVQYIWCLSFTVGLAQSFGGPAYSALVPTLVKKEDLQNAIALNSIQFNLARVVGPALGGVALAKLGAGWCFTLNGISFLAVIASLLSIRSPFTPVHSGGSVLESMKEGVNFLRRREGMVSLVALAFLLTLLSYPLITFLPVIARDVFHGGPNTFTLFLCLSGAGSVAGALVVASKQNQKKQARISLMVMLLLGFFIAVIGLSKNIAFTGAFIFVTGLLLMVVFALNSSLVQLYASDAMRGRVMSVYNVAFRGGMPLGGLISGLLIKTASAPAVMVLNGILVVVLALYFLFVERKLAKL